VALVRVLVSEALAPLVHGVPFAVELRAVEVVPKVLSERLEVLAVRCGRRRWRRSWHHRADLPSLLLDRVVRGPDDVGSRHDAIKYHLS
jgi:hypothetical protein